ncbi:MAG TPA: ATP-binding protein [Candidatus Aminicenantes bacterium]|nr:ATP-binding protein [Candidatus Aminicenantes bacterium]HRY64066.1 ATP-binding protein [Candidatus Aminicenantes bacterium]HRZ70979.1 ATP-binding protein [Candidatus Aminicenantes bacterium]
MASEEAYRREFQVKGGDFANAGAAACAIKELLKEFGLSPRTVRRAAVAAYEAEMNVIMYARKARIGLAVTPREVRLVVDDRGPGIADVELAMTEGYSTATAEMRELGFGAGMGLPNIKKNSDRFEIVSEPGRGTRLDILIRTNGHVTS